MSLGTIVILVAIALLLAYEAWSLLNKTPDDTITHIVREASMKRPLIPFVLGVLAGHFWWA